MKLTEYALAGLPLPGIVIDAHGHFGNETPFPLYDAGVPGLLAGMDRIGVDLFCVSPFLVLAPGYARQANDQSLALLRKHPGRFYPYMIVDVAVQSGIVAEMERCLAGGLRAIKIHSYRSISYSHPNYELLYEFAGVHGLPVLAHAEDAEIVELTPMFDRFPATTFILAHAGCLKPEQYLRAAAGHENVFLETCVSQCTRGLIEYFVRHALGDKILWGSDCPLIQQDHQIGRVIFADIAEEDKIKILGANALRVFGLEDRGIGKIKG
ncbi:hypothetical protein SDC9_138124 [bioreactor metagenome]|uniref:Amidohydrolase-related domain-containing protein n=1 Tax=bioreactor metagenome TaxID=1076179 RepID=A0A645DNY1_9ZZZZ